LNNNLDKGLFSLNSRTKIKASDEGRWILLIIIQAFTFILTIKVNKKQTFFTCRKQLK